MSTTPFADSSSVFVAQSLSAAVSVAYGLALTGLWLQYRRREMAAFARAWLLFGALAALAPIVVAGYVPGEAQLLSLVAFGLAVVASVAFLDATLVVVGSHAIRAPMWIGTGAFVLLSVVGMLLDVRGTDHLILGAGPRGIATAVTAAAVVRSLRAAPFPGRIFLAIGLAMLGLRFGSGLALELFAPGAVSAAGQPTGFTIVQLLTTMLAGYYITASTFAIEREATLRTQLDLVRQLGRSQRMESIGRMAGSAAHDFNNVLTVVLGTAEALADTRISSHERAEALDELQTAVTRGRALTRQMLDFSRPEPVELVTFEPERRLADLVPMIRRLTGARVQVEHVARPEERSGGGTVRASAEQFDQVLLNLAANARDAMPAGGRLVLRCEVEAGSAGALAGCARISVSDSGTGMTVDVAERIFDPYFTTKPEGEGTGLGLATAYAFAQRAGGDLTVVTAPGAGSTFTLTLPLAATAAADPGR